MPKTTLKKILEDWDRECLEMRIFIAKNIEALIIMAVRDK